MNLEKRIKWETCGQGRGIIAMAICAMHGHYWITDVGADFYRDCYRCHQMQRGELVCVDPHHGRQGAA